MNTISSQNPFFETYSTLHGTVPFDKIKTGDYVPAVREGIRRQNAEIDAIIRNPEVPTFANTVLAYEKSGEMLHRVGKGLLLKKLGSRFGNYFKIGGQIQPVEVVGNKVFTV